MAQQPHSEGRITRRPRFPRPRRQGADLPARAGGAGLGRRGHPQQQGHDAGGLGRQRQAAAGGQVELARRAPGLDHDGPERRAARRLRPGPEHALAVARPHQQHLRRVEPELGQARRMQGTGLGIEKILPDPEQRASAGGPQRQGDGEAGGGGEVGRSGRVDLMQGGAGEAAVERLVERGRSEGDALHRRKLARQPRQSETLPQGSQGSGGCIGHGRSICSLFVPI